jgi:cytochrome c oxidase subunit 6b
MNKWEKVFPAGISECLSSYFRNRASWAPKFDPRFPNQNQAKNCFVNYVDYQRCAKLKGEDYKDCDYFKQVAKTLCPEQWLEKYEEQLQNNAFPVNI